MSAPSPHILNCSKGKDSLPSFIDVGWRIHIARNVVCGPPMEESKGSALILKSKNIVVLEKLTKSLGKPSKKRIFYVCGVTDS